MTPPPISSSPASSPSPTVPSLHYRDRWFEDYVVGETVRFGDLLVSEAEVLDFAQRYDPQPFHLDEHAAAASLYGGIIASGWHTGSSVMRLMVDEFISACAGLGSPGLDEIRWLKPVRPGMRLTVRITIKEARISKTRPDRGFIKHFIEALNDADEQVMTILGMGMVRTRP